jgi:hypothetical protein
MDGFWNPQHVTRNLQPATCNLQPATALYQRTLRLQSGLTLILLITLKPDFRSG